MATVLPLTSGDPQPSSRPTNIALPRVVIKFCTQCRWMLRAAYFGQELLSTFGTTIGEIALQPTTGGVFRVELTYDQAHPAARREGEEVKSDGSGDEEKKVDVKEVLLWDRKAEGGFPETKVLKQRVRDYLEPNRDLGHSDRGGKKKEEGRGENGKVEVQKQSEKEKDKSGAKEEKKECEDCK